MVYRAYIMKEKKKNRRNNTKTVTTAAIFSALGVVFLYIGSLVDILDLTPCCRASLILVLSVIEGGGAVAWMIYASTSVISLLILPNKYPAVLYIFFAGLYPMVKSFAERFPRAVSAVIKLVFFNIVLTAIIYVSKNILHIPDDAFGFGKWILYPMCNVMLVIFDYMLTQLITLYNMKLRRRFRIDRLFF